MNKYGFLGLGIMGKAMATNLIEAGLDVTVWNRTQEKCTPLVPDLGIGVAEGAEFVLLLGPGVAAELDHLEIVVLQHLLDLARVVLVDLRRHVQLDPVDALRLAHRLDAIDDR
ncbi:MAG: NAD(P)-binding domain-containing protein, partial [Desulfobacterales bacterium]